MHGHQIVDGSYQSRQLNPLTRGALGLPIYQQNCMQAHQEYRAERARRAARAATVQSYVARPQAAKQHWLAAETCDGCKLAGALLKPAQDSGMSCTAPGVTKVQQVYLQSSPGLPSTWVCHIPWLSVSSLADHEWWMQSSDQDERHLKSVVFLEHDRCTKSPKITCVTTD